MKFRPYAQKALLGTENVYAAIGTTSGKRTLYFAAPIRQSTATDTAPIGAIVARLELNVLDHLLARQGVTALLVAPQGLVFAGGQEAWIGRLTTPATPNLIATIRKTKQFGTLFDNKDPTLLPLPVEPGLIARDSQHYAVAHAALPWEDPEGDWNLLLIEDLAASLSREEWLQASLGAGSVALLICLFLFNALRSHDAQIKTARRIETYAREQESNAARKARLANVSLRFQQTRTVQELGQVLLTEAHTLLDTLQGVFYAFENDQAATMRLMASYGCDVLPPADLALGEGLLGQCAIERRTLTIAAPGGGLWKIHSGLGDALPAILLMTPVQHKDKLLGVVEIALLKVPDAKVAEPFEEMVTLFAMNLEIQRRNLATEKILSLTALSESQAAGQVAFQRALVDTIPYPVFYKGADTRFLGFNRAYEETFKVRREDLIGKRVLDLDYLPEADRLAYQAEDEATIASAGTVRREMKIPFADGSLHDTLYFVSGFHNPDGSPGGLVGTFMDISQIKDAKRELEDAEQARRILETTRQQAPL